MDDDDAADDELDCYIALSKKKTRRYDLVCPGCEKGVPVLDGGRYHCPVCCRISTRLCGLTRAKENA